MLLQPDKSYFIPAIIKEVEANKARSHWTLMKKIEVNNKHNNKDGKTQDYFINLVFQAQEIHIQKINETHSYNLCIWRNTTNGELNTGELTTQW